MVIERRRYKVGLHFSDTRIFALNPNVDLGTRLPSPMPGPEKSSVASLFNLHFIDVDQATVR